MDYDGEIPTDGAMREQLQPQAERLDAIAEEVDEIVFDVLREASADGASTRPQVERTLTQARRAIDKASHLLRRAADD